MKSAVRAWRTSDYVWVVLVVAAVLYTSISEIEVGRVSYAALIIVSTIGICYLILRFWGKAKHS